MYVFLRIVNSIDLYVFLGFAIHVVFSFHREFLYFILHSCFDCNFLAVVLNVRTHGTAGFFCAYVALKICSHTHTRRPRRTRAAASRASWRTQSRNQQ